MDNDTLMDFIFAGLIALCFAVPMLYYLVQISNNLRMIRSLIAAFMEQQVSPTVAANKLAALVQEATKAAEYGK